MELMKEKSSQAAPLQQAPRKLFFEDGIGFIELMETFGSDLTVVNAARVSFHKESAFEPVFEDNAIVDYKLSDRDAKLIQFLAEHRHVTPFFHPQLRLRIKMPIFIARQWFKHTVGFTRNEVSRRYVADEPQCFAPTLLRKRDKNVKQGSSGDLVENNEQVAQAMKQYMDNACSYYQQLLDSGVCPEQARMVLPQAMYTEFIETASLSAYARLALLRLEPGAQKEIRDYAHMICKLVEPQFPVAWKALMDAGLKLIA